MFNVVLQKLRRWQWRERLSRVFQKVSHAVQVPPRRDAWATAALQRTKAESGRETDHLFAIIFGLAEAGADDTVKASVRAR